MSGSKNESSNEKFLADLLNTKHLEQDDVLMALNIVKNENHLKQEEIVNKLNGKCDYNKTTIKQQLEKIKKASKSKNKKDSKINLESSSIGEIITDLGLEICEEFFLDQYNFSYAKIPNHGSNHYKIIPVKSQTFTDTLISKLYSETGKGAYKSAVKMAQSIFRGEALQNKKKKLYNRCAFINSGDKNKIIYDLTSPHYDYVTITNEGIDISKKPTVDFYRYATHKEQFVPESHGEKQGTYLEKMGDYFNLNRDKQDISWHLLKVSIAGSFIDDIAFPIICPYGPQGSAKTTMTKIIKSIIDPSITPTLAIPKKVDDMVILLFKNYYTVFDNVSDITEETSDILSRAVTGEGYQKRTLFTDLEQTILKYKRKIALNGINIIPWKPDLMDRTILFEMERLDKVKKEQTVLDEIKRIKPYVLWDIFNYLSEAIKIYPTIKEEKLPRLADYGIWGEAISRAMGYPENLFLDRLIQKKNRQDIELLESKGIAKSVIEWIDDLIKNELNVKQEDREFEWEYSPDDMFQEVGLRAEHNELAFEEDFPKSSPAFIRKLRELIPNLKALGIIFKKIIKTNNKRRYLVKISPKYVKQKQKEYGKDEE